MVNINETPDDILDIMLNDENDNKKKCARCKINKDIMCFNIKKNDNICKICEDCNKKRRLNQEKCIHLKKCGFCLVCSKSALCEHDRQKAFCKICFGTQICPHSNYLQTCKMCGDSIKITIKNWIYGCKQKDQKNGLYNEINIVDKPFLKNLVIKYPMCYYDDCKRVLQYKEYNKDLSTIERLNNDIGHVKSNCVICCLKCNLRKKSNNKLYTKVDIII